MPEKVSRGKGRLRRKETPAVRPFLFCDRDSAAPAGSFLENRETTAVNQAVAIPRGTPAMAINVIDLICERILACERLEVEIAADLEDDVTCPLLIIGKCILDNPGLQR